MKDDIKRWTAKRKFRTITDTEGNRRSVELLKRVRTWWFTG